MSSYLSIFHKRFAKKADAMSRRTGKKKKAFAHAGRTPFQLNWPQCQAHQAIVLKDFTVC
jgi:hypothetical protein